MKHWPVVLCALVIVFGLVFTYKPTHMTPARFAFLKSAVNIGPDALEHALELNITDQERRGQLALKTEQVFGDIKRSLDDVPSYGGYNIMIGPESGLSWVPLDHSVVFIGPRSGRTKDVFVEFTDGDGNIMFQITDKGVYRSTLTPDELAKKFKPHYYYWGTPK